MTFEHLRDISTSSIKWNTRFCSFYTIHFSLTSPTLFSLSISSIIVRQSVSLFLLIIFINGLPYILFSLFTYFYTWQREVYFMSLLRFLKWILLLLIKMLAQWKWILRFSMYAIGFSAFNVTWDIFFQKNGIQTCINFSKYSRKFSEILYWNLVKRTPRKQLRLSKLKSITWNSH